MAVETHIVFGSEQNTEISGFRRYELPPALPSMILAQRKGEVAVEERNLTFCAILAVILVVFGGPARAVEYTHIWIDQATGINHPDTNGTPDEPFKSITYALARAGYLGRPEPWHVHIGPGVYDADPNKPPMEPEVFPISLRDGMIFEGAD